MNERKNNANKKDKKDYYFPVVLSQTLCCFFILLVFFYVRGTAFQPQLKEYYSLLLKEDFFSLELDKAVSGIKDYFTNGGSAFAVFGSRVEPYKQEADVKSDVSSDGQTATQSNTSEESSLTEGLSAAATENKTVPLKLSYKKEEKLLFPLYEGRFTSYYGERTDPITEGSDYHMGIDIGADEGDRIRATNDGKVLSVSQDSRSGKYVFIDHGNDTVTFYCHCSEILVKKGDRVERGDTIALVGSTGYSTGPHLHFEVRIKDVSVDPLPLLEDAADNS